MTRGPLIAAGMLVALLPCASAFARGESTAGYAELVRRVAPSVVTVLVEEQGRDAGQRAAERVSGDDDDATVRAVVRRLLGGPAAADETPDGGEVIGSGFVIRADGVIVTNRHVILGARSVRVKLADGRELPVEIMGSDAATDLAILKVAAGRLPALRLGSSARAAVGDPVIAIGNPFGLGQTVTAGIISARGRTLEDDPYIDFLQTDAAINRGNSGGPLLAADGTVVGVTSVIFSPSGGSVGLGFAIPGETVTAVAQEIEAHGQVERGYLGISTQALNTGLATALGLKTPAGSLICALQPSGPAAGRLAVGDVITGVGSKAVGFNELGKLTARTAPGTTIQVNVMRDGLSIEVPVTLGRLPEPATDPAMTGGLDTWVAALEIRIANASPEIRKALQASDETGGVIITTVRRAGAGFLAGLKRGDLLTHAGTRALADITDLANVSTPTPAAPLLLRVVRGGVPTFVAVTGVEESP
jgi:serine protease Do